MSLQRVFLRGSLTSLALLGALAPTFANAVPKVVVISLDGATPRIVDQYLNDGSLPASQGIGLLKSKGIVALNNSTISPSLTAAAHIAIATGSTAAKNDVVSNTFSLVASPIATSISGFASPIGGYTIDGPAESSILTATPLWTPLRAAGKTVVAVTWAGADGATITAPGISGSPVLQSASKRTVDITVPFGAFAGQGARGFPLTAASFTPAPASTTTHLTAAGKVFFGTVQQTSLETITVGGVSFTLQAAALDTTNDSVVNYDTLVFFDSTLGIPASTPTLPATGPAYVHASDGTSSPFYFQGSTNHGGCNFFVSQLAPDLSTVHVIRYSANGIPRNAPILADVDDIETHLGFWAPQADFRIPERLSPGFETFTDQELEAAYEDQVKVFVDYQTRVALRGIQRAPNADLVLVYLEQPDGSAHQFLLTDPRQATNPINPNSIGAGQDAAKVARYASFLRTAYQTANTAVQQIINAVGVDGAGRPNSDVFVVSDHGFDIFHTAVSMPNLLATSGVPALSDTTKVRAVASGPAVNVYINLSGRESGGTVSTADYPTLQQQIVSALTAAVDTNATYTLGGSLTLFDKIYTRPLPVNPGDPSLGRGTAPFVGQDSGDVVALMRVGYNFDGTQSPVVRRQGDPASGTAVLSVPNFYGAHGYDPTIPNMSAVLYAAGPHIGHFALPQVHNIDVAPTVLKLLNVAVPTTVDGTAIPLTTAPAPTSSAVEMLALAVLLALGGYWTLSRRAIARTP